MQLSVNGDALELPERATLSTLIDHMSLTGKRIAIEVNQEIIPRSQHAEFELKSGDQIEVVHAIGGG
jgi:sulfur carrier protein